MPVVGYVESLWRYPVKSMGGEKLQDAFVAYAGLYGDRIYAFHHAAAVPGFPYLTGRELAEMLLYRPRFRYPEKANRPPNLTEAERLGPGATPVYPSAAEFAVDVETPAGDSLAADDPILWDRLGSGSGDAHKLTLLRSDRAMTDCRPISLISTQSITALGGEVGLALDQRRFRANIYVDLGVAEGFQEDAFVGRSLRIGAKTVIAVLERDPRCKMITLDPDTAQPTPEILRKVAHAHDGKAGIYAAVLVEGTVRPGDEITLLT